MRAPRTSAQFVRNWTRDTDHDFPDLPITGYSHNGKPLAPRYVAVQVSRSPDGYLIKVSVSGFVRTKSGIVGINSAEMVYMRSNDPRDYTPTPWGERPEWLCRLTDPTIDEFLAAPIPGASSAVAS